MKGYRFDKGILTFDKELTELDLFVKHFLDILKKHSDYLIVSGFVSISTGRARATEDVDILIPAPKKEVFEKLFNELIENNFWCYQGDSSEETWEYAKNMQNIRFAKQTKCFQIWRLFLLMKQKKQNIMNLIILS